MSKSLGEAIFRGNVRNYGRGECRNSYRTVMIEAGTGLERDHFPEIVAIIELEVQVKVDPGQVHELAQIGIEFFVINVGNMIISHGTVQCLEKKRKLNSFNKC